MNPRAESPLLPDGDFKIAPPYADAPELAVKPGVPRGTVREFVMESQESKIFPGLNGAFKRNVAVYVPEGYVAETPAPLLVVLDGASYKDVLPRVLDNMIHDLRVPPVVALFIDSAGDVKQRGLEYDSLSENYAVFVETEVLPRAARENRVTISKDPRARAALGGGPGGAAAFTMAWTRPDLFRRVLSYSGAFVAPPDGASHGAWDYHAGLIAAADAKPLHVWLAAGEKDDGGDADEKSMRNTVLANRRMAAALKAKTYRYRSLVAAGAAPADRKVVNQTLPEALQWLWQGFPTE